MGTPQTPDECSRQRRGILGAAAATIAIARLGVVGTAEAQTPPARLPESKTDFASLRQIDAGVLDVGYAEVGRADGPVVILLHGWPHDIHSYVDAAPLLASAGYRVIVPNLRGYGTTRFLSDTTPGMASKPSSPSISSR